MSISHWGMFPGYMTCHDFHTGCSIAVWDPCDFDFMEWLFELR